MDDSRPKRLSFLDRYLTLWIFAAMAVGVGLGYFIPAVVGLINTFQSGTTNIPIAVGLVLMMYPPLAKVKYEELGDVFRNVKVLFLSLVQNWIIGPLLMFALAVLFLRDYPHYMYGLILIGLARCIAMVIVWNELAKGDTEYAAGLVALNSIFQVIFFSVYAYVFITVLPGWFGLKGTAVDITIGEIAQSVFIYLGIPFLAGIITRFTMLTPRGRRGTKRNSSPKSGRSPWSPFSSPSLSLSRSRASTASRQENPRSTSCASPFLVLYFSILFLVSFFMGRKVGRIIPRPPLSLLRPATTSSWPSPWPWPFSGLSSGEAFAAVIGPLIEVPVMIALVGIRPSVRKRYFSGKRPPRSRHGRRGRNREPIGGISQIPAADHRPCAGISKAGTRGRLDLPPGLIKKLGASPGARCGSPGPRRPF